MTVEQKYTLNVDNRLDDEQCMATIDTPRHGACIDIVVRYAGSDADDDILLAHARDVVWKLNNFDTLLQHAKNLTWYREGSEPARAAEHYISNLENYNG